MAFAPGRCRNVRSPSLETSATDADVGAPASRSTPLRSTPRSSSRPTMKSPNVSAPTLPIDGRPRTEPHERARRVQRAAAASQRDLVDERERPRRGDGVHRPGEDVCHEDPEADDLDRPVHGAQPSVNAGSLTIRPPFSADSCAQSPTQVQFAERRAFGNGSRSSSRAAQELVHQVRVRAAVAAPCVKDRCVLLRQVVDALRREAPDRSGQAGGVVGHLDPRAGSRAPAASAGVDAPAPRPRPAATRTHFLLP